MTDLANNLWVHVNKDNSTLAAVNIRELSITANQKYTDMLAKKVQWKTVDDGKVADVHLQADQGLYQITVAPQVIRTFSFDYVPIVSGMQANEELGFSQ